MSAWLQGAACVVRAWSATYTLGVRASVRDERRAEIASDIWEQQADVDRHDTGAATAVSLLSRMVRGAPADILWRVNMEGPKMDIRIPLERVVGGMLLGMVVLLMVASAISGYDTSADGFESQVLRLAEMNSLQHNVNALVRAATGFALIGAAAGFYVALRERSRMLATVAAFGISASGVLVLVAGALQLTFVRLAEDYVSAADADQASLLATARAVAIAVEQTTGVAFLCLVSSTFVLAVLAGRERLVPRWLIGIPVSGAVLIGVAFVLGASGLMEGSTWMVYMAGMLTSALWLLIAGLWLVFSPSQRSVEIGPGQPAPA
jgi:hypothetical protein